jgi:hypothetical protein
MLDAQRNACWLLKAIASSVLIGVVGSAGNFW